MGKGEAHSVLIERDSGKPVRKLDLRTHDGKPLEPAQTFVKKLPVKTVRPKARPAAKAGSR